MKENIKKKKKPTLEEKILNKELIEKNKELEENNKSNLQDEIIELGGYESEDLEKI